MFCGERPSLDRPLLSRRYGSLRSSPTGKDCRGVARGKFVLRVPPPVHQALALKARAAGKSLNTYCAERLSEGWR